MSWINVSHVGWFKERASDYGGTWTDPKDYPAGLDPEKHELGAIIAVDGTVKHRIRDICITQKCSLLTPKLWQT